MFQNVKSWLSQEVFWFERFQIFRKMSNFAVSERWCSARHNSRNNDIQGFSKPRRRGTTIDSWGLNKSIGTKLPSIYKNASFVREEPSKFLKKFFVLNNFSAEINPMQEILVFCWLLVL